MATDWEKVATDVKKESDTEKAAKIIQDAVAKDKKDAAAKGAGIFDTDLKSSEAFNANLRLTAKLLGDVKGMREAELELAEIQLQQHLRAQDTIHTDAQARLRAQELLTNEQGAYQRETDSVTMALVEQVHATRLAKKAQDQFGDAQRDVIEEFGKMVGISSKWHKTFIGKSTKVLSQLKMQGKEGDAVRKAMMDNIKETFNWQNLLLSVFSSIFEMTSKLLVDFDKQRSVLAGATGAAHKYSDSLYSAQRAGNLYGIDMAAAGEAVATLANETSNFAKFSDKTQASLALTTAKLGKLGVDAGTAAETFQFLNLNLGMTAAQAEAAQVEIAIMGTELGISAGKMSKEFNASMKTLAVYGPKAVEVFKNLAGAAKAAGVETSALLTLAGKFDTFQGSAETVGKLNALLGTQLSTTQMLMMTEDERIETLINQVQAQGVAFKDMDRFTQKAVAAAAGIDDMNEAQRIFGMNLGDYKKNQEEMAKNEAVQEKFNEAVAATVPVMQKFKLLATEAIIAVTPLLEKMAKVAEYLTEKLQGMTTEEKESTVAWIAGASAIGLIGAAAVALFAPVVAVGTSLAAIGPAGAAAAGGITATGTAITGVLTALGTLLATPVVGEFVMVAMAVALALGAMMAASVIAMSMAHAAAADAGARQAEAQASMAESMKGLTASSSDLLASLQQIGSSDFSAAIESMSGLIAKANEFGAMKPKATATIENLALLTVGKAKDSMTGNTIIAGATNMTANIENVFKQMHLSVDIGGEQFDAKVSKIAADVMTEGRR